MGLPPPSFSPIRLLTSAQRTSRLSAGAASLVIHGALLALVVANSGHWRSAQPVSPVLEANVLVLTQALAPPVQMPEVGTGVRDPNKTARVPRSPRGEYHTAANILSPLKPAELIPTTVTALAIRAAPPRPVATSGIRFNPAGLGEPVGNTVQTRGRDFSSGSGYTSGLGIGKVAELIGKTGEACPVLRLPRTVGSQGTVAVAVTFVVDTFGTVDRSTLRVVERPGQPPEPTVFVPHIYAVGASVQVDGSLDDVRGAYGTIVAGDVLRHVAALRFRPALRNGLPVRSSVLVACQTG